MHVKYTKKMEDMILSRYRSSKTVQIETAKELLVDLENTKVVEAAAGELEVRTKLNGLISTLISVGSLVV